MKKKLLITALLFLPGCTTTAVWENNNYTEIVNSYLVTEDGEELVFQTQKYHYIFSRAKSFNELLQWDQHNLLEVIFDKNFVVSTDNKVKGEYKFICNCAKQPQASLDWLKSKGFRYVFNEKVDCESDSFIFIKEGKLDGTRYQLKAESNVTMSTLNSPFKITIEESPTFMETTGRLAITPITLTIDTILLAGQVAVVMNSFPRPNYQNKVTECID